MKGLGQCRVCEDYDLWLRILKEGNIDLIPQKLLYKHAGEANQLSMNHKLLDRCHVKSLFKHAEREDVRTVMVEMIDGLKKAGEKYEDDGLLDECAVWELRLEE